MKTFTDNANRTWTVAVNVGAVKRMRDLLKLDLAGDNLADVIGKLANDPVALVDTLWVILQPQAEAQNVSAEAFADAVAGDVITRATEALLEEIVDFFPEPKRRTMRRILELMRSAERQALERLEAMAGSPEMEARLQKEINSVLTSAMK